MKQDRNSKTFIFSNKAEEISVTFKSISAFISEQLELNDVDSRYKSRISQIIIEFLTNGVKHAGSENSKITVEFGDKKLVLKKRDNGSPFLIKSKDSSPLQWPLNDSFVNRKFSVYQNNQDFLKLVIDKNHNALFFVENMEGINTDIDSYSEHFGLIIITKNSDNFSYYFDEVTKTNVFTCGFDFD